MAKRELEEGDGGTDSVKRPHLSIEDQEGAGANGHMHAAPAPQAREFPPGLELPSGWIDCPPMGHRMTPLKLVPIKVPLGQRYRQVLSEAEHFSPWSMVQQLQEKGTEVGLIIDLTNTWRYYDREDLDSMGVEHLKIPCRGRGQVPQPEAVNWVVWELIKLNKSGLPAYAAMHCTHGFNRTGFMVVSYLVRHGMTVQRALRVFAEHRPPGIYKGDYIRQLYAYYHEPLPRNFTAPELPTWKLEEPDSPRLDHILDEGGDGAADAAEAAGQPAEMRHDDVIGEAVCEEEALVIRQNVMRLVLRLEEDPDPDRVHFPGGQPVSLDRGNLGQLRARHYMVTWKADGTRYMLLLCSWGTYLIDRAYSVRRVQMRFPKALVHRDQRGEWLLDAHHFTLLDGEMLVDEDLSSGAQTRRFLAYDCMAWNTKPLGHKPWQERWHAIEEVLKWRRRERQVMAERDAQPAAAAGAGKDAYPIRYYYGAEPFSVRRKEFWPLTAMQKLLTSFIPNLSHESDGLIFQDSHEPYVSGTDMNLLKWKFAHLNSVDFLLRSTPKGADLYLLETRKSKPQQGLVPLPGAKVIFPEGEDARQYEGCIVECSWLGEEGVWNFLRTRGDKQTPNAYHVYEKVMQSIHDNITEEDLLAEVSAALREVPYEGERRALQKPRAAAAAPT